MLPRRGGIGSTGSSMERAILLVSVALNFAFLLSVFHSPSSSASEDKHRNLDIHSIPWLGLGRFSPFPDWKAETPPIDAKDFRLRYPDGTFPWPSLPHVDETSACPIASKPKITCIDTVGGMSGPNFTINGKAIQQCFCEGVALGAGTMNKKAYFQGNHNYLKSLYESGWWMRGQFTPFAPFRSRATIVVNIASQ